MTYRIAVPAPEPFAYLFTQSDAELANRDARLAAPGEAEAKILDLFTNRKIAYIAAHNAAHGCFAARAERTS